MLNRRNVLTSGAIAAVPLSFPAWAQSKKDTLALGLVLEPTGLEPPANASSSIREITLHNISETLTRLNADGNVTPQLTTSWQV